MFISNASYSNNFSTYIFYTHQEKFIANEKTLYKLIYLNIE